MKIQSSNTKQIYSFEPGNKGEERHLCPECSHNRKKKTDKCLAWDNKGERGYCHNCVTSFFEYSPHEPKQYTSPVWKNITSLSDKAVKYFESRMISQKTLLKMRVYFFNDKLVNVKFRGPNKSFKLVSGAELIFWNLDCVNIYKEIILTEGEIDALTFIENGFDNVLSVPNGANKNLEYLDTCIELFKNIEKIYIASDQDTKGIELRDELIRRFGAERCYVVSFKDCKDANDYFQKYGDSFKEVIAEAKAVPVKGIIEAGNFYADIRDLYLNGVQRGKEIGQKVIDDKITWETGRLAIVTGVPSSGKSEFVDYIVAKLNLVHGWKAAYFTPENYPLKFHYAKIFEKLIGKKFDKNRANELEYDMAFDYFRENYFYILNEEDFTIKSILDSAKILVKTRGIKILVIDPYNKLEHKYTDSETQYISRFLDQIITFAKLNDLLLFLIAHPVKMQKNSGKFEIPSLYSISGSANFYNKTDYGLTVHRKSGDDGVMINEIEVHVQKVKYKHLGEQGIIDLKYDYDTGRFNPGSGCDLSNWLMKTEQYKTPKLALLKELEFDNENPPF
jgi:twinkle protein